MSCSPLCNKARSKAAELAVISLRRFVLERGNPKQMLAGVPRMIADAAQEKTVRVMQWAMGEAIEEARVNADRLIAAGRDAATVRSEEELAVERAREDLMASQGLIFQAAEAAQWAELKKLEVEIYPARSFSSQYAPLIASAILLPLAGLVTWGVSRHNKKAR